MLIKAHLPPSTSVIKRHFHTHYALYQKEAQSPIVSALQMSKRHSTAPPPPKPPTNFSGSSSLVIADAAQITGTHLITLSSNTIIHPRTKLLSTYAPITIGSNCILSERATIGLQSEPPESLAQGVIIADYVVIEVGARVEAKSVGEGCIIEVNAKVGKGAVLGKVCGIPKS